MSARWAGKRGNRGSGIFCRVFGAGVEEAGELVLETSLRGGSTGSHPSGPAAELMHLGPRDCAQLRSNAATSVIHTLHPNFRRRGGGVVPVQRNRDISTCGRNRDHGIRSVRQRGGTARLIRGVAKYD